MVRPLRAPAVKLSEDETAKAFLDYVNTCAPQSNPKRPK